MMKLTEHIAKGQPCALRLLPPCDQETVQCCHLPAKAMKGTGMKTPDVFAVPGCQRCHDIVDRRGGEWREIPADLREERMRIAMMETISRLIRDGIVRVPK